MVVDEEIERKRFLFSLNFQFRREHFYGSSPPVILIHFNSFHFRIFSYVALINFNPVGSFFVLSDAFVYRQPIGA